MILVLTAIGIDAIKEENITISARDMIACLARMNAEKDKSVPECSLYCFLEVNNFIKDNQVSVENVKKVFPDANETEMISKCASIQPSQDKKCHWANDAYDCIQRLLIDTDDSLPPRAEWLKTVMRDWKKVDILITIYKNLKTITIPGHDMIACQRRMKSVRDKSVNECNIYCFMELTSLIRHNKISFYDLKRIFPDTNVGRVKKRCDSKIPKKDKMCHWADDTYDCIKKNIVEDIPLRTDLLKAIAKMDFKTENLVINGATSKS